MPLNHDYLIPMSLLVDAFVNYYYVPCSVLPRFILLRYALPYVASSHFIYLE